MQAARSRLVAALMVLAAAMGPLSLSAQANRLANEVAASGGRVIVMLRPPTGAGLRAKGDPVFNDAALDAVVGRIGARQRLAVRGRAAALGAVFADVAPADAAALAADPEVLLVEADRPWPIAATVDDVPPAGRLADVVPWGVTR